jgi:hypothetical protein
MCIQKSQIGRVRNHIATQKKLYHGSRQLFRFYMTHPAPEGR